MPESRNEEKYYRTADGEIRTWIEDDASIHLKAVSSYGDPVELTGVGARELASVLIRFAEHLGE